jgi:hypothetical protein
MIKCERTLKNLDEIVEVEVGCRRDGGIGSTTTLYTRED